MSRIKLFIGIVIIYIFLLPSTISAELSDYQFEIIRVAFTNGYTNVFEVDIETIKALREDNKKIKKFSQLAAKKYMEKVCVMNQSDPERNKDDKKVLPGSNSLPL